jgi:DNA-binding Lrp family transcriptional regulator
LRSYNKCAQTQASIVCKLISRPEPFEIRVGKSRASLSIDGKRERTFAVRHVDVLTRAGAEELLKEIKQAPASRSRIMITFERSSPDARAYLRERRSSYAAADGEVFLFDPPLYVERPPRRKVVPVGPPPAAPFANRASRVPRWLLLHAAEQPSFRELATRLELSEAMVSRTMRALADDGLVAIGSASADARLRLAQLPEPAGLLDAFERAVSLRPPRRVTWEIGARDAPDAIRTLQKTARKLDVPYAIGGVAGAALAGCAAEPVDVLVWIRRDDVEVWAKELTPVTSRPAPGRVTMQLTRDPFVLSLASDREGIQVADPVQLYLDCRAGGEGALEVGDAIRAEMRW